MKKRFYCKKNDLIITGTEFLPEVGTAPFPAVIISHEFLTNRKTSYTYAEELSKHGYVVFTFDFCGGSPKSASEGSSDDMSVITEIGDLKTVFKYADELDYIDSERIVLMGCSQGGLVSALVAAELNEKIAALVLLYPAFTIPAEARKGRVMDVVFDPKDIPPEIQLPEMKLGKRYATDVMYLDPYEMIGAYQGKVLIIHGDADAIVDMKWSRLAQAVYKKGGAEVELKPIPKAGHIFRKKVHKKGAVTAMLVFLDCKLGK